MNGSNRPPPPEAGFCPPLATPRHRLDPRAQPGAGLAHALRDGAHPAVLAGQQGDDPVRLTELLGAQDDALVAVEAHLSIVTCAGAAAHTTPVTAGPTCPCRRAWPRAWRRPRPAA